MAKVDADLYEFLRDKELHLILEKDEVIAIAFIHFSDLADFVDIVGRDYFIDDGGVDVKLQDGNICIEMNDIFEYYGNTILDYKNCFNEEELKEREHLLE